MVGPYPEGFMREAYEAIESLDRRSTTEEVIDAMRHMLSRVGFEFFCLTAFPNPSQRSEDVMMAIQMPEEWHRIYVEQQYVHVSPAVRHCKQKQNPFRWRDAPYDPEREPRATEYVHLVTDFGLSNGLVFPTRPRRRRLDGQQGPDGLGGVDCTDPSPHDSLCIWPGKAAARLEADSVHAVDGARA